MEKTLESVVLASRSLDCVATAAYLPELVAQAPTTARVWGELCPRTGTQATGMSLALVTPMDADGRGTTDGRGAAAGSGRKRNDDLADLHPAFGIAVRTSVRTATTGITGKEFVFVQNDSGSRTLRPPV